MSNPWNTQAPFKPSSPLPRPSRAFAAYIATDKDFRGIGKALSRKLEERFGDALRDVIAERDPRVAEILGSDLAEETFATYDYKAYEADVVDWLQRTGIDDEVGVSIAIKIARCWAGDAVQSLAADPYVLLAFLNWATVDRIAGRLGVPKNDWRRKIAAVEATLYARLDSNDTLVPDDEVGIGVRSLLSPLKLVKEEQTRLIEDAVSRGAATRLGNGLQPSGAAVMEAEIANWVSEAVPKGIYVDLALPFDDDERLVSRIDDYEKVSSYPLTERQRDAIFLGLRSRVMVLAGYAGSGKTTSLRGICEIASAQGRGLHLMALSGRAAQRMSESTGMSACTIAGFLQGIKKSGDRPASGDIVIVDEASMVDLTLLWRLLRFIDNASLILVGDPAQLPPIGFGLTFHIFCKTDVVPKVVLDRVLRQTAESGIPAVAESVRFGRRISLPRFQGRRNGVTFDECADVEALGRLHEVFKKLVFDGADRDQIQILSPVKSGAAGIETINRSFHGLKRAVTGAALFPGRDDIAVDDPIIWTQNDWKRGLMNGSFGRLESAYDGEAKATLDGAVHDLSAADANFIAPAYAISVHKAQGSQWPIVIVPVFRSRILDRTLLYTAITRAQNQVVLIGNRKVFEQAIVDAPAALKRRTGLLERLY